MADDTQNQKNDQRNPGLSWTQPVTPTSVKPTGAPNKTPAPHAPEGDSTGRVIGIILGIVIVFILIAWGIVAMRNKQNLAVNSSGEATTTGEVASTPGETTANEAPASASTPTPATQPNSTALSDTLPFSVATTIRAGTSVAVTGMKLSAPTWILVYEEIAGHPGKILGAGLFFTGDSAGTVDLLRPLIAGSAYYVSAAIDNGDKVFSLHNEKILVDKSGAQLWIKFNAN